VTRDGRDAAAHFVGDLIASEPLEDCEFHGERTGMVNGRKALILTSSRQS
jgi:hypothetical protein